MKSNKAMFICRVLGATLLLLPFWSALASVKTTANTPPKFLTLSSARALIVEPPTVDGYYAVGRGSCQDADGRMYSYLQRTMEFPTAEACGKQECERFGGLEQYRGFEYSVTKRCTCVFDEDKAPPPPVPADPEKPEYVTKMKNGVGPIAGTSGTPGANCYRFEKNSGLMAVRMGAIYKATIVASVTMCFMF
ncbi:hypothetical protein ACHAXA_000979 [Cyclostephanos tholiformis]|uniref:Uncharacterized protein n=1 Tax=Cyclostephanos tholiformis TaxID=382380 RepID=A0ABD3SDU1_9STRA